jgi:diguanylate cyclase (GGDEF)-like protein
MTSGVPDGLPVLPLERKAGALLVGWARYRETPVFDHFVELSLLLNNLTEYLFDQAVPGLAQFSRDTEQLALSLFGDPQAHPIPAAAMQELDQRISLLLSLLRGKVVADCSHGGRRTAAGEGQSGRATPPVWFVGDLAGPWGELVPQLGYFGLSVQSWEGIALLPLGGPDNLLLIVDVTGVEDWDTLLQQLRERYPLAELVCLSVPPTFLSIERALRSGADVCVPLGRSLQRLVSQILEMHGPLEEEAFRVLVVEDSRTAAAVICKVLEGSDMEALSVRDPAQVLDALYRFNPDLILMDMHMPGHTGVETARVIRQNPDWLSIPIVYLSAETDIGLQVDALRLGGDNFLTKPVNPVLLSALVRSKIERYRELRRSMYHDSLTGLLNHTSAKASLASALDQAALQRQPFAVAMLDIDFFKQVNDQYGHPVGDQVILSLAWLLRQRLRSEDIIGRYGGEEFVVGLSGSRALQMVDILERIRVDFGRIAHPCGDSYFASTFSAGVADSSISGGLEAMLAAADAALYRAKRSGRNRICSRL